MRLYSSRIVFVIHSNIAKLWFAVPESVLLPAGAFLFVLVLPRAQAGRVRVYDILYLGPLQFWVPFKRMCQCRYCNIDWVVTLESSEDDFLDD